MLTVGANLFIPATVQRVDYPNCTVHLESQTGLHIVAVADQDIRNAGVPIGAKVIVNGDVTALDLDSQTLTINLEMLHLSAP